MNIRMEKTPAGKPYIKMDDAGRYGDKAYTLHLDEVLIRSDGEIFKAPPETKGLDLMTGAYLVMAQWWLEHTDGVPAVSTADPPDGA